MVQTTCFPSMERPTPGIEPSVHISLDTTFNKTKTAMEIYSSLVDAVTLLNCYAIVYLNAKYMRNDRFTIFRYVLLKVLTLGYLPFQWISPIFCTQFLGSFHSVVGSVHQSCTIHVFPSAKRLIHKTSQKLGDVFFGSCFFCWEGKNKDNGKKIAKTAKTVVKKWKNWGAAKNHGISSHWWFGDVWRPLYTHPNPL